MASLLAVLTAASLALRLADFGTGLWMDEGMQPHSAQVVAQCSS